MTEATPPQKAAPRQTSVTRRRRGTVAEAAALRRLVATTTTFVVDEPHVCGTQVYVVLDRRGHDCEALRSRRARVWLRTRLYRLTGRIASDAAIDGLCDVLEGLAFERAAA